MDALFVSSKPRIANDRKPAADERTDSLTTLPPHEDARSCHKYWHDYLSRDLKANQPTPNQLHHPGNWRAHRNSPISQQTLPEVAQDLQDTGLLRFNAFATSPPTRMLTHPQRILQVPWGSCKLQALRHCSGISEMARPLPQCIALPLRRKDKGATTTHSDFSQPLENNYMRECRGSNHSRYRVAARTHFTSQHGHVDAKEATTVFHS